MHNTQNLDLKWFFNLSKMIQEGEDEVEDASDTSDIRDRVFKDEEGTDDPTDKQQRPLGTGFPHRR